MTILKYQNEIKEISDWDKKQKIVAKDEFEKNKRYITFEDIKNLCVENKSIKWIIDDKYLNENILSFDGAIEFKTLENKRVFKV